MIFTVGHSNHAIETFLAKLGEHKITHLVDCRSKPYSRFSPQFNQRMLEQACKDYGVVYQWTGKTLGGFSTPGPDMAEALDRLAGWTASNPGMRPAMMCAEKNPFDCHRHRWLANYLIRSSTHAIFHLVPGGRDWQAKPGDFKPLPEGLVAKPYRLTGADLPAGVAARGYADPAAARAALAKYCPKIDISGIVIHRSRT